MGEKQNQPFQLYFNQPFQPSAPGARRSENLRATQLGVAKSSSSLRTALGNLTLGRGEPCSFRRAGRYKLIPIVRYLSANSWEVEKAKRCRGQKPPAALRGYGF